MYNHLRNRYWCDSPCLKRSCKYNNAFVTALEDVELLFTVILDTRTRVVFLPQDAAVMYSAQESHHAAVEAHHTN